MVPAPDPVRFPRLGEAHLEARLIDPEDAARLERMFFRLSPETVYRRFFTLTAKPRPAELRYLASVDHGRREAVVAVVDDEIVAVARYDRLRADPATAEIAITVEDAWQRRGIASFLLHRLADLARERGIERFTATILGENRPALALMRSLHPHTTTRYDHGEVVVEIPLT